MGEDLEYSFWDHLDEARAGIIRALVYILIASVGAWFFRDRIFWLLEWPAWEGAKWANVGDFNFRIFEPVGGLVLMMYAALIVGATAAAPVCLWEMVRFVNPALTPRERKFTYLFIPGFVGLFIAGVVFCYFLAPAFCWFLLHFNLVSFKVAPEWTLVSYLRFLLQCLVATGFLFELPMVIMFLVWMGLMTSAGLRERWRGAVVIILIVVAVVSPTTDPITMTVMSLPLVGLYFLSISLAKWIERGRERAEAQEAAEEAARLDHGIIVGGASSPDGVGMLPSASLPPSGLEAPPTDSMGANSELTGPAADNSIYAEAEEFYRRQRGDDTSSPPAPPPDPAP